MTPVRLGTNKWLQLLILKPLEFLVIVARLMCLCGKGQPDRQMLKRLKLQVWIVDNELQKGQWRRRWIGVQTVKMWGKQQRRGEDKNKGWKREQTKRVDVEKMQKGGKDKHFTERGIIMQLFSRVIIRLQAVRFFTEKQQEFRGASKPPTVTYRERSCQPRCYL